MNRIVHGWYYNRDNNEVEEFSVLHEDVRKLILSRTPVCLIAPDTTGGPLPFIPGLAPPVGPFSQAIKVGGFIFFSGQVGQDPTTGELVAGMGDFVKA